MKRGISIGSKVLVMFVWMLVYTSCKQELGQPVPEKQPEMSEGKYNKYVTLLGKAYAADDKFEAGLQLANLKADASTAFTFLNEGLRDDPAQCERMYQWYYLYDQNDFGVNILLLDTTRFKKSVLYCYQELKQRPYEQYAKARDEEMRDAEAIRAQEDSTNWNMPLVYELRQIAEDDQYYRIKHAQKGITEELRDSFAIKMNIADSINLAKIDRIFKEYGYPSRDMVGRDGNFTPAMVIHHSNSLEDRYRYMPLLEKAVADGVLYEGTLDMIKRRITEMELDHVK